MRVGCGLLGYLKTVHPSCTSQRKKHEDYARYLNFTWALRHDSKHRSLSCRLRRRMPRLRSVVVIVKKQLRSGVIQSSLNKHASEKRYEQ